ncbi:MAG: thiamine pyrophosphate-binding protein [Desulfobacterales bacterium]|nr:thiamine pyrophosphate-binding protein [Desulfobacterales bacterium]
MIDNVKKVFTQKTGAWLTVYALEQLPVSYTFGIPGVHNTELYDELSNSNTIQPILVTHECGAAFMADAVSRTSNGIGVLVIVPAAGITHAMSGIGEAFLDGIPMLIISGGIRKDTDNCFQLHDIDHHALLKTITKKTYLIKSHKEIVPTLFEAYSVAISGEPGPVYIELPVNIQLFKGDIDDISIYQPQQYNPPRIDHERIRLAAELLIKSKSPGLFLGWGCKDCQSICIEIAELLQCPVATTLQGFSVFPGTHPLHTGMGFGGSSVPAAENAFHDCDCLLAVGTRFSEIPTGSFGVRVPEHLIHIDINPHVFHKNYPAKIAIHADAEQALNMLLKELKTYSTRRDGEIIRRQIDQHKQAYLNEWFEHKGTRVNPARFFASLRTHLSDDAIVVVDDGNHTFLTAELLTTDKQNQLICPTDFNCMGYCVPAAIGAKLANMNKQVIGIVGDGAFLMTCMELITASTNNLGIVYFVFYDGELSQIAQGQEIPYNRKTCTILGNIRLQGIAEATGSAYLEMITNEEIDTQINQAFQLADKGQPVIVDIKMDYSKRTRFTKGLVKTVIGRFPLGDKFRFIGRAMVRRVTG